MNLQMAPVDPSGIGDGHRRSAAHRHVTRRASAATSIRADAGAAAQRPQLDGPHAAGGRQPGRTSSQRRTPGRPGFQLNVDGQQVTQQHRAAASASRGSAATRSPSSSSSPTGSTPRQGRSTGVQVNAITKSGTNTLAGIVVRLLPRRQLQRGGLRSRTECCRTRTSSSARRFGGPIRRDRIHFFANYEYEREPQTLTYTSPYPELQHRPDRHAHREEGRRAARLSVLAADAPDRRAATVQRVLRSARCPLVGRRPRHPSIGIDCRRQGSDDIAATSDAGDRRPRVNEIKAGYCSGYHWKTQLDRELAEPPAGAVRMTHGSPIISCAATRSARRTTARTRSYGHGSEHSRRLHLLVHKGGPSRPEDWAASTSTAPAVSSASLPAACSTRRAGRFRPTSRSCSPCGTTSRPGTSTRCRPITRFYSLGVGRLRVEQPDHDAWPAGRRTTGRSAAPDAESRRPLRHHQGHVR